MNQSAAAQFDRDGDKPCVEGTATEVWKRPTINMLTETDVQSILALLKEESGMTDARGVDYVNYYGMLNAKKRYTVNGGKKFEALFSPKTFLKLQAGGAVSTFVFEAYLRRYSEMLRISGELSAYDVRGKGTVSLGDLEKFMRSYQVFELLRMSFLDVPMARCVAARKFRFYHGRNHQLFIQDIVCSTTMQEMLQVRELAKARRFQEIEAYSWFSRQSIESVVNAFRLMDPSDNGYVLQDDLVNFEGTKFSALFIQMVFETYIPVHESGELRMDLAQFADFVLAWRDRTSAEAVSYFFKVFDIDNKGYLSKVDIHMFFKEICEMWVVARNEGWEDERLCENVVTEIMDMAQSRHQTRFLKEDLIKCGRGSQIIGMLADMVEFWKFEVGEDDDPQFES